jgi:hypothetical protein
MNSLGSLEEGTPQQYRMKVMSELLMQAHIIGVDLEEFIGFFAVQVQAMLMCPPNFNKFGQFARVWVMRGFYPDTSIFFKLVLMHQEVKEGSSEPSYFVKVSPLRVKFQGKVSSTPYDAHVTFNSVKLNDDITNRMENAFLGANHKLEPIMPYKLKMPRCMAPKGLKILKYKKPRKKKKNDK